MMTIYGNKREGRMLEWRQYNIPHVHVHVVQRKYMYSISQTLWHFTISKVMETDNVCVSFLFLLLFLYFFLAIATV